MKRIAILDPRTHVVGLKAIFPEADYYGYPSNTRFDECIKPMDVFENVYKFKYITNWSTITDKNYDILIVVFGIFDVRECSYNNAGPYDANVVYNVLEEVRTIMNNNKFEKTILFDNYDYDYDPSTIRPDFKFDVYFKRNYQKDKKYASNVFPFPMMGFGFPCCLWDLIKRPIVQPKIYNDIFWSGTLFIHDPPVPGYGRYTNRHQYYHEIADFLKTYSGLSYDAFRDIISKHKFALDLPGVGDPNRRYYEILTCHTLAFTHKDCVNIKYPFDGLPLNETIYNSREDFIEKLTKLQDESFYNECLEKQTKVIQTYCTSEWLSNYILYSIYGVSM